MYSLVATSKKMREQCNQGALARGRGCWRKSHWESCLAAPLIRDSSDSKMGLADGRKSRHVYPNIPYLD